MTILKIESGSPADKAGLKIEDRVIGIEIKNREWERVWKADAVLGGVGVNLTIRRGKGTQL